MINFFILFINTFSKEKKKLNENFATGIMLKNKELEQKLLPFLFRVNV